MPERSEGDLAQIRLMAEQVATATIVHWNAQHPDRKEIELPAPLKWAGGIAAAIITLAASAGMIWLVTTVNDMQVTLARMDERMMSQDGSLDSRFAEMDRRVSKLEVLQTGEGT